MRRALALAIACGCGGVVSAPAPRPQSISPTGAYRGTQVRVRIAGQSLDALVTHNLGGGDTIDATFHVRIGGVELSGVRWVGSSTLEADVPADLPAGMQQEVVVVDPLG